MSIHCARTQPLTQEPPKMAPALVVHWKLLKLDPMWASAVPDRRVLDGASLKLLQVVDFYPGRRR